MPRTAIRPGWVIRDILMQRQPIMPEGDFSSEATPTDLYRTYTYLVKEANHDSVAGRQRGMSRHSFNGLLYQARRLALIVAVREEFAEGLPTSLPPRGPLLNINGVPSIVPTSIDDRVVVEARRIYYRIGAGAEVSSEWDNISKAYKRILEVFRT